MKEFWAKNKIWLVLVLIVLILVISVIVSESKSNKNNNVGTLVSEISEKFNGKGTNVIYIMSATCSWCEKFTPIVEEVKSEYDVDVYKVDLANITSDEEYNELLKVHTYLSNTWSGGTPTVVVLKDGKVVKDQSGYSEKDTFVQFLKDAKVIE